MTLDWYLDPQFVEFVAEEKMGSLELLGLLEYRMDSGRVRGSLLLLTRDQESIFSCTSDWEG